MNKETAKNKSTLIYVLIYFILWIVLFEFILPVNNILPKPSIVWQSFSALWQDYNLPVNYLNTISSIYLSITAGYFIIHFISPIILNKKNFLTDFIHSLNWFSNFLPGIVIGMMIIFWFPESNYIEFIFVLFTSISSFIIFLQKEISNVPSEYTDAARSLGVSENKINKQVIWNSMQSDFYNHIIDLHLYIWPMIIAFEFIKGGYGLGNIFRLALMYKDLSALFSTFIITGLTIYLGIISIRFFRNKFAYRG
jgi:ABC-type nitrate/sulfonate/bicarbonate transport system permease component